jgi:hypothetical protein
MTEDLHKCPRCGLSKPFDAYHRDESKSNGRRFICRACDNSRSRAYYEAHRARILARVNAYNAQKRPTTPVSQRRRTRKRVES